MNDNTYQSYIEKLYNCYRIEAQDKCEVASCMDCKYFMRISTKRDIMAETLRRIRESKKQYDSRLKAYNPVNLDKLNGGSKHE